MYSAVAELLKDAGVEIWLHNEVWIWSQIKQVSLSADKLTAKE